MSSSIWASTTSRYGEAPESTKAVSKTTARRWFKEDNRSKVRRSRSMKTYLIQSKLELIAA